MDEPGAVWEEIVIAAWNAYASGMFGQRDIQVAVSAAMEPFGYT